MSERAPASDSIASRSLYDIMRRVERVEICQCGEGSGFRNVMRRGDVCDELGGEETRSKKQAETRLSK